MVLPTEIHCLDCWFSFSYFWLTFNNVFLFLNRVSLIIHYNFSYIKDISENVKIQATYFGIFYSIFNSSRLVGDLYGITILPLLGHFYFYLLMTSLTLLCTFGFLLLKADRRCNEKANNFNFVT